MIDETQHIASRQVADRPREPVLQPASESSRSGLWRGRWSWIAAGSIAVGALTLAARGSVLSPLEAIVLGAVEGITEFLPVSSTGHLLVTERLLGLDSAANKSAADTYAVAIQLGAILAVIGLYRARLASMFRGAIGRDRDGRRLLVLLIVAFMPSAIVGLALDDTLKQHLFGVWPVVAAWLAGGVFLLLWRPARGQTSIDRITVQQAAIVGAAQVVALWPGTSRSLVTIAAALAVGITMSAAVEFSFLLGLATLSAATVLDLGKHGGELTDRFGIATPILGALVAMITAALAVTWFVEYLRTRSLRVFGWYRIAAASATMLLIAGRVI